MKMNEFWGAVRATEAQIEEEYPYIVSVEAAQSGLRGGVIVQVTRRVAAERITERTHRLASPEEIVAHQQSEAVSAALAKRGPNPQPVVYLKRK